METWRDIDGYVGSYQVSDQGNVRSLNWRGHGGVRNLFLKKHRDGYLQVELFKDGVGRMIPVHRLVAKAFVPGYAAGLEVNHIDENKRNNVPSNLEWCTHTDNVKHSAYRVSRRVCRTPAVVQKTSAGEVVTIWPNVTAIKKALGYNDWSIRCCCTGKRSTAYGFTWQYAT